MSGSTKETRWQALREHFEAGNLFFAAQQLKADRETGPVIDLVRQPSGSWSMPKRLPEARL